MANIRWKDARWEAAHSSLSIPELLTVLKGFGPMEVLRFELPGCCIGEMSLCLTDDGTKEITLYHLEVVGEKRRGQGRESLRWLREIFKGAIFLEFPDLPDPEYGFHPSMPFWFQMYREGLIDALDCENFYLDPQASSAEIEEVEQKIISVLGKQQDSVKA